MCKVAVLVPCYNEELTVEKVVKDFKRELPTAEIYVYDNNSKDKTAALAIDVYKRQFLTCCLWTCIQLIYGKKDRSL